MSIENIMFFALGILSAGLLAILLVPSILRRAVRLTRRRIEAATPMTLNEFRADKDKLRADFAVATARQFTQFERMREKMAATMVAIDSQKAEVGAAIEERDQEKAMAQDLRGQLEDMAARLNGLERDNAELNARLAAAQASAASATQAGDPIADVPDIDPDTLSGDYRRDVEDLLMALGIERQRNSMLEEQARMLLSRMDSGSNRAAAKKQAVAQLRQALEDSEGSEHESEDGLTEAQDRIARAETRLSALVSNGHADAGDDTQDSGLSLAQELSAQADLDTVRASVLDLERSARDSFGTQTFAADALRNGLETVATDVSRLVYADDAEEDSGGAESLFDRVRKFSGADELSPDAASPDQDEPDGPPSNALSDRMAALRNAHAR